jgi:hypothetical protein
MTITSNLEFLLSMKIDVSNTASYYSSEGSFEFSDVLNGCLRMGARHDYGFGLFAAIA